MQISLQWIAGQIIQADLLLLAATVDLLESLPESVDSRRSLTPYELATEGLLAGVLAVATDWEHNRAACTPVYWRTETGSALLAFGKELLRLRHAAMQAEHEMRAERGEPSSRPRPDWFCDHGRWLRYVDDLELAVYRKADIVEGWGWRIWSRNRDAETQSLATGTAPSAYEAMITVGEAFAGLRGDSAPCPERLSAYVERGGAQRDAFDRERDRLRAALLEGGADGVQQMKSLPEDWQPLVQAIYDAVGRAAMHALRKEDNDE